MREILFKGKRKDNGKWVLGYYTGSTNSFATIEYKNDEYIVIPETVCQYTGSIDKNGRMIFENDIVKMPKYGKGYMLTKVYFKDGKFAVDDSHYYFKDLNPKSKEVVGNIYDNPELLDTVETNGYADQDCIASAI